MPAHARKSRGPRDLTAELRQAGRSWRRSRPFTGAVLLVAAGAEIGAVRLLMPIASPRTIVPPGALIAAGIVACGLLLLFDPVQRSVYATVAVLLAISALTTSHLGGFLAGTLLGTAGGAIAFAWVPAAAPGPAPGQAGAPDFRLILGEADDRPDPPGPRSQPDRPVSPGPR